MNKMANKLSFPTKLGYGAASIAESTSYNVVSMFLLYFLTNFAGVSPGFAGTIMLFAVAWDAVTDPAIGYWSDNSTSKQGRRRPFLIASTIPLFLSMMLLFSTVDLSPLAKNIYYIIIAIAFWTSYTVFAIPYLSLGAELTPNYNERTSLRSWAFVGTQIGIFLGGSAPFLIIGYFISLGNSEADSWKLMAMVLAAISCISILITWLTTKGKELPLTDVAEESRTNIIKTYKEIIKLKPYKYIILSCVFYLSGFVLVTSDLIYFMTFRLGLGEVEMSMIFVALIIFSLIIAPIFAALSSKFSKRKVYIVAMFFSGIIMVLFRFIGIDSLNMLIVYICLFGFANTAYNQLIFAIAYDVCEVDEFVYGQRREGVIISLIAFFAKFGAAIAVQILGLILQFTEYNPETFEQTPQAINGITSAFTIIPGCIITLAGIFMILFPLTKERYTLLTQALEHKKQGKEYLTKGLEKIV